MFFSLLKKERVHSTLYKTREQAKVNIIDYVEMYYNSFRRHLFLGKVLPKKFFEQVD